MKPEEVLEKIRGQFGEAVREAEVRDQTVFLLADGARNFDICQALHALGFEYLSCLSGVDWRDHFEVVYNLASLRIPTKVHLRVTTSHDDPRVRSVVPLWDTANWHEREAWDLVGIRFEGHPDHRRILLPEDWVGHPLRKDYVDEGRYVSFTFYGESKKAAAHEKAGAEKGAEGAKPAAGPAEAPAPGPKAPGEAPQPAAGEAGGGEAAGPPAADAEA